MGDLSSQGQMWLMKAAMSGNAFRLPETIEPGKFEQTISLWYTCLCGNMKTSQVKAMRNFKYLWRRDDEKIATRPNRGIAANFKQLQFLMISGRIDRSDFPSITLERWATVEDIRTDLVFKLMCESCAVSLMCGITSGYYKEEGEEDAGATAKAYFDKSDSAVEAMDAVYANMELYLPYGIFPSFALGSFGSYESLMSALRRFYGEDECQQTMIDVIRKIVKLAKKDQRMEQKMAEFREIAHKYMIVDRKEWIKPRDFTDDRSAFMEAPENYGPFTVTMLLAMCFSHNIPESRWPSIQALFSARCTDISYKGWHENRPELYKIMDAEKKTPRAISGVDSETIAYANNSGWKKGQKKNQKSNQFKAKKTANSGKGRSSTGGGSKTVERMCRTCTQAAGKPIYHDGPYGGGRNCKYNKNGKPKRSRGVNSVQQNAPAEEGDSSPAGQEDQEVSSNDEGGDSGDNDNGAYALYEDYYPSFGGGFGSDI